MELQDITMQSMSSLFSSKSEVDPCYTHTMRAAFGTIISEASLKQSSIASDEDRT